MYIWLSLHATQISSLAAESDGVGTVPVRLVHYVTAFSPNCFSLSLIFHILAIVILSGQTISGAVAGAIVVDVTGS